MKRYVPRVYSHLITLRESSIRENGHEPPLVMVLTISLYFFYDFQVLNQKCS